MILALQVAGRLVSQLWVNGSSLLIVSSAPGPRAQTGTTSMSLSRCAGMLADLLVSKLGIRRPLLLGLVWKFFSTSMHLYEALTS